MRIYNGDCKEILATLPENSVDSVVTDPPYGLSFMNKHWDYDVPSVETWQAILRVLKPGGHLAILWWNAHLSQASLQEPCQT